MSKIQCTPLFSLYKSSQFFAPQRYYYSSNETAYTIYVLVAQLLSSVAVIANLVFSLRLEARYIRPLCIFDIQYNPENSSLTLL